MKQSKKQLFESIQLALVLAKEAAWYNLEEEIEKEKPDIERVIMLVLDDTRLESACHDFTHNFNPAKKAKKS